MQSKLNMYTVCVCTVYASNIHVIKRTCAITCTMYMYMYVLVPVFWKLCTVFQSSMMVSVGNRMAWEHRTSLASLHSHTYMYMHIHRIIYVHYHRYPVL